MKIFEIRIILTILVFVMMLLSGIWLSRKGKPYNMILFNIHKMISLAAILMMVLTVLYYLSGRVLVNKEILTIICTGFFFIILLFTGGLLNIKKEIPRIVLIVHRLSPIVLIILSTYLIYKTLQ